jgi:hypothetical protein
MVLAGLLYLIALGFVILAAVPDPNPRCASDDDRGERIVFAGLAFVFAIMGRIFHP